MASRPDGTLARKDLTMPFETAIAIIFALVIVGGAVSYWMIR